jgi:D-galactarolactone cycloisomerase
MAIDRVETFVLVHQMARGRGPSIANYTTRESVVVKISDSSGAVGWGETYASAGIIQILRDLGQMLIGHDPLRSAEIHDLAWNASNNPEATSVIAIANDDLRGKLLNLPVYKLYGGALRTRVRGYASSGGYFDGVDPKDSWPDEFAQLTGMGFTAIKMRVGRYPIKHELAIIEKLRADYPDLDFMADGNAAYTVPRAMEMGRGLAKFHFRWFEEPIPQSIGGSNEYAGYERMRDQLDLPLAGGEGLVTRGEVRNFLLRHPVDIIQPDVAMCGGIGESQFLADLARLYATQYIPHAWGGALMLAATIQVLASLPDTTKSPASEKPLLEYDMTENPFRDHLLATPLAMGKDGWFDIPTGPGLGVEVDEAFVAKHAVDPAKAPVHTAFAAPKVPAAAGA